MSAVQVGEPFPDFLTQGVDTRKLRMGAPLFAVIWKKGCSTCRFAMPFYQRLHEEFPGAAVVGISQDDAKTVTEYCSQNGLTFPQIADEEDGLALTRVFKPVTVPCYFLTDSGGEVLVGGEAWDADALNEIGARLGAALGVEKGPLVPDSEPIARFKPG